MAKRLSKEITNKNDLEEILSLSISRAREKSLIMDWFADFGDGPRFNPYDTITIPAGKYGIKKKNKNAFKTTIGLWVFNKCFIEDMSDVLGYVNETVNNKVYGRINQQMSYALLEEKITLDQMKQFILQTQIWMGCASAICPSHSMDMILLTNKAEVKKKQLERQYAEGLKNKDVTAMKAVENELVAWAKNELKDSESADMYNSGARSSWDNNFKNMYLTRGVTKQTDGELNYVSTSYISGMNKDEYSIINDAAVGGPYSRSRKTALGGYDEKKITNATQHIKVGKKGSDCGTDKYITVELTKSNINDWMYHFVIGNNGLLTEITTDTMNNFIGKKVKLRFSSLCKMDNGYICEKCASSLYRRIGIENMGLGCMIMASSIKNTAMKAFHDSTTNLVTLDVDKIF